MVCTELGERDKQTEKGMRQSEVQEKCLVLKFIRGSLFM